MDNMDMEVVVCGLVVHIQLELVRLDARIHLRRRIHKLDLHVSQPGNMLLAQVTQAPDIAPLDQPQQVQRVDRLAVPVEVRQEQEPLHWVFTVRRPVDDVLGLLAALDDVEGPVQPPPLALRLHEGPHMFVVDLGRLGDVAHALFAVFLDVLLGARPDEVDLEVGEFVVVATHCDLAAVGQVPVVDVVGTQVLNGP
ncbi:hypothetical protein VTI74DRAFT_1779 [Chaetomium olivicolor]